MPTNDSGDTEAQEGAEDKTSDENNEDVLSSIEDEEVREKVRNKIVSEREQKKHWRDKAQTSDNDESADNDSENDETDESPDVSDVNDRITKLEQNQKLARDGYSDDEIAEARAYAQGKDMDVTEAIETEFVQSAIQTMREKNKSQETTPGPSSQVKVQDDKTFQDIVSDEDMSKSEKNEALQNYVQERLSQGRTSHE